MSRGAEVLRNIYNATTNTIGISGTIYSGGIAQQLTTTQDLSVGALNYTTVIGENFSVNGVYFVFDSATTQDISLEYNGVEIFKETATLATSASIITDSFKVLGGLGNELTIKCTNNGTPVVNVDVKIDIEVV